MLILSKTKI